MLCRSILELILGWLVVSAQSIQDIQVQLHEIGHCCRHLQVLSGRGDASDDEVNHIHIVNHVDVHCDDDRGDNDPSGPKV